MITNQEFGTAWERVIVGRAERAANRCIACGERGHYTCECPKEFARAAIRRLSIGVEPTQMHSEFWLRAITYICGFITGGILAWLVKR